MARKRLEVARVAIGYTVLPGTKEALGRLAVEGVSAGEVIDRAVARYEREGGTVLLTFDAARVLEWMNDPQRAPASQAFTAGDERQVAYRFEEAAAEGGSRMPASPYAETRLKELSEEWNLEPKMMLDLVLKVFGRSPEIGEPNEAAHSTDAAVPPTGAVSAADGVLRVPCNHCGGWAELKLGAPPTSLCGKCFLAGHRNFANCFECAKAEDLEQKKSRDSSPREDVDYGAFNDV